MDVVIVRRIPTDHLQRVPGQVVSAVIIDGLACREQEEKRGLADCQTRESFGECGTQGVEKESFDWVIVERAKRVWDVKPVVYRVKVLVEELVDVHAAMEEILPCVQDDPVRASHKKTEEAGAHPSEPLNSTGGKKYRYVRSK